MIPTPSIFENLQYFLGQLKYNIKAFLKGYIPQSELFLWQFRKFFVPFMICAPDDFLTPEEISDVERSLVEISEGKCKKFKSIDEALAWLKSE